ncbi:MAG: saccharopine dehydrogenase family protein [Phenylobacterium sp.]
MSEVLIYGAAGYTGRLCAEAFVSAGLRPILAGRQEAVRKLAARLDLKAAVFDLSDPGEIAQRLEGVRLVLNLSGQFLTTQKLLIEACLAAGAHYVDLAGEVEDTANAFTFDERARQANIMIMPGAGFNVAPSDVAAVMAKEKLPEADHLVISLATEGGVSRGTLKGMLAHIEHSGHRRVGGALVAARPAETELDFHVAGRSFHAVYDPWLGDLFTAGVSTGIPNISTYSVFPWLAVAMMKGRLLWLRDLIQTHLLRFLPEGSSARQLRDGRTYVLAIASKGEAQARVALVGPEAYKFTVLCLREITRAVLAGRWSPGFQTPGLYGKALLDGTEGVTWDA